MKKTRFSLILLFLIIPLFIFSQTTFNLTGTVRDAKGKTLPGAHVFLANTTYGTITNKSGDFNLRIPKRGSYQFVVSFAGFKNYSASLNLIDNTNLKVVLEVMTTDLGDFEVVSKKDRKWKERLAQFKQVFLGTSENSKYCEIINEEEIDFHYDEDQKILESFSSEPILIRNKALDYDIEFYLEEFKIYYSQAYSVIYGFPLYKEIFPNRVSRRRDRKRLRAYNGSVEHFFKALSNNTMTEEGFIMRKGFQNDLGQLVITNDTILNVVKPEGGLQEIFQWRFKDYFVIDYLEEEDPGYVNYKYNINLIDTVNTSIDVPSQRSWIRLEDFDVPIQFEKSGYVLNPISFAQYGYWGFEKIADRVPINYRPKQ